LLLLLVVTVLELQMLLLLLLVTVLELQMLRAALVLKQRLSYLTCIRNGRSGGACSSQTGRWSPSTM
jgi:hypothetical protein